MPINPKTTQIAAKGFGATLAAAAKMALLTALALVFLGATGHAADPNKGEKLYRANCFACHGVDPAHDGPLGPAIQGSSRALLKIRLEKGLNQYPPGYTPKRKTAVMPPLAHLLGSIDDLLAYINQGHAAARAPVKKPLKPQSAVARGRQTFNATCAGCHQRDGVGKPGLAPSLTDKDFLELATDKFIKNTIQMGRPGTNMISFAFLPSQKIDEVIAYLRSFQKTKARQFDRSWKARGNAARGKTTYQAVCSQCHGSNGKGYVLGGSGTGIGLNGFLSVASDGYIKQVLLTGREGSPMRPFGGPLGMAQISNQEMDNIIVYLRKLGKQNAAGG